MIGCYVGRKNLVKLRRLYRFGGTIYLLLHAAEGTMDDFSSEKSHEIRIAA